MYISINSPNHNKSQHRPKFSILILDFRPSYMRLWEQKWDIGLNKRNAPNGASKFMHNNSHWDWQFCFSYIYIDFTVLFKHFSSWLRARAPAPSRSSSTSTQRQKASDSALERIFQWLRSQHGNSNLTGLGRSLIFTLRASYIVSKMVPRTRTSYDECALYDVNRFHL